ncbi:uncharacterized protein UV8b_06976 [Ustilaginoidea virens]|uniref:Survival protein SurE-like phosphatase/nucleotidase domain-containing protein n=1 Tax=Ustilaginoidea virens TaxID=1159556 RepID=A0A8E5HW58_USTVR|nr:uncharacterized protein UV8b_06976 [Ustilaginoidea virens]QUC22735.1 hypothetical protein UV8b_06976 [Ustilaginoidea virens]
MRLLVRAVVAAGLVAGARILQTNEEGWAEQNVRLFNDALRAAGHDVVLSCPAYNSSNHGMSDKEPRPSQAPCHYNSCPESFAGTGANASRPDLNWVSSYAVTAARHGIERTGPRLWGGAPPDLVVVGPGVGPSTALGNRRSSAVGAACYAARRAKVPAVLFAGANRRGHPWNEPPALDSAVFARVAANVTQALVDAGPPPLLPRGVYLNVNMPRVAAGGCARADDVRFYLTRTGSGFASARDVAWCRGTRLPTEIWIQNQIPCAVSLTVVDALDLSTAPAKKQKLVLDRLRPLLSCLP